MSQQESAAEPDAHFMDLYSRQIGTYGLETMLKLTSLKVLILGVGGTAAEAAKNLALAGIHTVALYDNAKPTMADLGVNFAFAEDALSSGATRAELTAKMVAELNPNTRVKAVTDMSDAALITYDCVIVTGAHDNISHGELTRINSVCRTRAPAAASFIVCINGGPIATMFADHGEGAIDPATQQRVGFVINDFDGRAPLQKSILEVSEHTDKKGNRCTKLRYETPEGMLPGALRDYTEVKFTEVKGLCKADGESINDKTFKAIVPNDGSKQCIWFYPSLQEQGYTVPYKSGGFLHEQKERTFKFFKPLETALREPPQFEMTNAAMDLSNESKVHALFAGVLRHGRMPRLHNDEDADAIARSVDAFLAEGAKAAEQKQKEAAADEDAAPKKAPEEERNPEWPAIFPPPPPPGPFTYEVDGAWVKQTARVLAAELQPVSCLLGAMLGQEVVKITGKFTPVFQFLHFNFAEALPDSTEGLDCRQRGDRYDHIRAIYGEAFVQRLLNLRIFMVGCGALGCENVKNFALTGMCCGPNGKLIITDNDIIEISNLNRQFLFRGENVGKPKSQTAGDRGKVMNKALNVEARKDFVADSTEHIFTDDFWMSLDCVCNALDNMKARLYVDTQCVLYEKPLIDAGTMGTGGNVDVVVPFKTKTYADGGNADESGGIPMCTLRNFPYIFDHCIEWARAQFDDHFVSPMQMTSQLRENPAKFVAKMKDEVFNAENMGARRSMLSKNIKAAKNLIQITELLTKAQVTMSDCVALAWHQLHSSFRDKILSLIKNFPEDCVDKKGNRFWSGHKKFPSAVDADLSKPDVVDFLISCANCYACMLGVHEAKYHAKKNDPNKRWKAEYRTRDWIASEVAKLEVPPVHYETMDDLDEDLQSTAQAATASPLTEEEEEALFNTQLDQLAARGPKLSQRAAALDFEKDDDDNFHIDYIAATANLRATNYEIETADRHKVKMVAGKIIPAIATTTAAVTGFVLLEYFKTLLNKPVEAYRLGSIDLGGNTYTCFEPTPPNVVKTEVIKTYDPLTDYTEERTVVAHPPGHTKFDKIRIPMSKTMTVQEFADALLKHCEGAEGSPYAISVLGVGTGMIWNGMPNHKNTNAPLRAVIAKQMVDPQSEGELNAHEVEKFWENKKIYSKLAVNVDTDDMDEVALPTVVLEVL